MDQAAESFRRSRWQEWVIVLALLAIFATGVMTLWGDKIRRLVGGHEAPPPTTSAPTAGPAAGPF